MASISRARAMALRTAASMIVALVRRTRSRETAWITARAARVPAGVTMDSPSATGAWRTAANSISSPPARLSAPPTPVDIHSERLAGLTIASTSSSQISPFQSSIRAKVRAIPHRSVSVRRPTGPAAAWYTRGNRPAIWVTTSQVFVVRVRARSSTLIRSSPWAPMSTNSSLGRDWRTRDVGDVEHDRVHRDVPDERCPNAAHEGLGAVREGAGEPIAVAERQRRDAAGPRGRERRPVADAVPGGQVRHPDRASVQGHDRPKGGDGRAHVGRQGTPGELVGHDPVDREARSDAVEGLHAREQPATGRDMAWRDGQPGFAQVGRRGVEARQLVAGPIRVLARLEVRPQAREPGVWGARDRGGRGGERPRVRSHRDPARSPPRARRRAARRRRWPPSAASRRAASWPGSPPDTVTRWRAASPASATGMGYSTRIGPRIPPARSASASSSAATQNPSAPAASRASATGTAP